MIHFKNGGRLVETASELPTRAVGARELYLDFETTSGNPAERALKPYKGHRFCGVAVAVDDVPGAWYVPARHRFLGGEIHPKNVDLDAVLKWLRDVVGTCRTWVNSNVKFDAHVAAVDGAEFHGELYDTVTAAKLVDSDRLYKGGYGLKALSSAWLEEDIRDKGEAVKAWLGSIKLKKRKKAQDFGLVPPDILGEYACQDAIAARELKRYIERAMPEECRGVFETEKRLTPVLFDMEREGMRVDPDALQIQELRTLHAMLKIEELLEKLLGFSINPASPDDCYDALVNHYGLPVTYDDKTGNPTFDKAALKSYLVHPDVAGNEKRVAVITKFLEYRKLHTLLTFFIRPYQEHQADGIMHPDYNQVVRSGRLSCSRPNAQQLSKEAKLLVLPPAGSAFLSCDYSQIEFRLMVHYIRDVDAIRAYQEDPSVNFHQWVASLCGLPYKPAKNLNFAIGYGAGKKKVTSMLAQDMTLMSSIMEEVDSRIAAGRLEPTRRRQAFDAACIRKAEEVYETYHERLPGIKATSRRAASRARARGYVFNAYGRRAHLPDKFSHLAFNRVIQGCAADIVKERTVALAPRYNEKSRQLGLKLVASVHDETLLCVHPEILKDPETVRFVVETLEMPSQKFDVPIRTSAGASTESWAAASSDECAIDLSSLRRILQPS